jgi:hypothetical protein
MVSDYNHIILETKLLSHLKQYQMPDYIGENCLYFVGLANMLESLSLSFYLISKVDNCQARTHIVV